MRIKKARGLNAACGDEIALAVKHSGPLQLLPHLLDVSDKWTATFDGHLVFLSLKLGRLSWTGGIHVSSLKFG